MQKNRAIVTGASSGIGFALVNLLLKADFDVLAIARSTDQLQILEQDGAHILSMDISSDMFIPSLMEKLQAMRWDKVDAVVNNAGFLVNKPFGNINEKDLDQSLAVNFKAPFFIIQALVPFLEGGQVLNISTMGGINGTSKFPGLSAYSSSKGALGILTELLAEELQEKNIRVNALALGAVDTPMLRAAFPGYQAPKSALEMADYILGFIQKGSQFFNGKVLPVSSTTP